MCVQQRSLEVHSSTPIASARFDKFKRDRVTEPKANKQAAEGDCAQREELARTTVRQWTLSHLCTFAIQSKAEGATSEEESRAEQRISVPAAMQ